jgi:hypothetical protein
MKVVMPMVMGVELRMGTETIKTQFPGSFERDGMPARVPTSSFAATSGEDSSSSSS